MICAMDASKVRRCSCLSCRRARLTAIKVALRRSEYPLFVTSRPIAIRDETSAKHPVAKPAIPSVGPTPGSAGIRVRAPSRRKPRRGRLVQSRIACRCSARGQLSERDGTRTRRARQPRTGDGDRSALAHRCRYLWHLPRLRPTYPLYARACRPERRVMHPLSEPHRSRPLTLWVGSRCSASTPKGPPMSSHHVVVWIDHQQAHVLHFDTEDVERAEVKARSLHEHSHHGKERSGSRHPTLDATFCKEVAQAIGASTEILITGPAQAKEEFMAFFAQSRAQARDPGAGTGAIRPSERATDPGLCAQVLSCQGPPPG